MKPKTDVRFFRDPALPGIDIGRVTNSRHSFPEHFHDDLYVITLIQSGTCQCLGRKQTDAIAGPGSVTLLNPGQIHSGVPLGDSRLTYTVCHFSYKAMNALAENPAACGPPEFTTPLLDDPLVRTLMNHLFQTLFTSRDSLEKEALMISACHFIISRYGHRPDPEQNRRFRHQSVAKARKILSQGLDQKLSLAEVAQNVGLSRYHFLRTFKHETGMSPHIYRTIKRVEAATSLLTRGIPPAQVALATGFNDQSHFSNTFRRYIGATPKQYLSQR